MRTHVSSFASSKRPGSVSGSAAGSAASPASSSSRAARAKKRKQLKAKNYKNFVIKGKQAKKGYKGKGNQQQHQQQKQEREQQQQQREAATSPASAATINNANANTTDVTVFAAIDNLFPQLPSLLTAFFSFVTQSFLAFLPFSSLLTNHNQEDNMLSPDDLALAELCGAPSVSSQARDEEYSHPNDGQILELTDDDVKIQWRNPLGTGGFCIVYPAHIRETASPSTSPSTPSTYPAMAEDTETEVTFATVSTTATTLSSQSTPQPKKPTYSYFDTDKEPLALKTVRQAVLHEENELVAKAAIIDLEREAKMLSSLSHPHILKLYAVRKPDDDNDNNNNSSDDADGDEEENKKPQPPPSDNPDRNHGGGFFIVVEKLSDTLESKLAKWANMRGYFERFVPKELIFARVRDVAISIADCMAFLHSRHIIFRDLKPDNVGFDRKGRVKIFDFGLAHQLKGPDDVCRGRAGSFLYMAPEVLSPPDKNGGYGIKVDVFSYAVLLWQMFTARVPFEGDHYNFAVNKPQCHGKRPPIKQVESKILRDLIEEGWSQEPNDRPTFLEMKHRLEKLVEDTNPIGSKDASTTTTTSSKSAPKAGRFSRKRGEKTKLRRSLFHR